MDIFFVFGWYALLIAIIGDLLVSTILSLFYKEYSIATMSISALGNPKSPVRLPFNIWMFLEGILFLLSLPVLYNRYHLISGWITIVLIAFIAVFGIGACIFTAFFSVNETKDIVTISSKMHSAGSVLGFIIVTISSKMHSAGSVLGFIVFLFVPLLLAILSFKGGEMIIGVICIICFIISLVFFALFVMSDKKEFANTVISNEGLWQRLNLFFMYLPLAIVSIQNILQAT